MSRPPDSPFRREPGSSSGVRGSSSGSGPRGHILPPIFEAGNTIADRYRIVRFIGRGGMGEVYEAEDLDLQVRVALKTVRPEIADHDIALERFRREIQLARKVTHPNVCRIFDVGHHRAEVPETGEEREIVFLTMEHLEGPTLASRLRDHMPMDEDTALPIIEQMTAAIDAAHEAGIVHRDFKSSNVILVPEPGRGGGVRAVVTDFGLARGIQPEDALTTSLSSSGQAVGTPTYMAPEQVAGSRVTPSVDIYALGVVVFEMMTGRPPFVSDSPLSTAVKRLIEPPPPPRSLVPGLSSRWESGILRCLEKDPESRFDRASDLVRWIRGDALFDRTSLRSSRPTLTTTVMLVVLISLVAGFLWWRNQPAGGVDNSGGGRPLAAVLGFRDLTGSETSAWLSTALQEMLSMELAASEKVRVVSGDTVARARRELGLQDMQALSTREIDRISRHLGADLVILGSYFMEQGGADPQIRVDVRVHRRGAEEVVSPVMETGRRSDLLRLVSRTGATLREELGYETAEADTTTALIASYPVDPDATMAYARGLDALRRGDPIEARRSLERSLEIEPGNALAHSALSSSWSFLGYDTRARAAARRAMDLSQGLPREERLLIEARYYESASEWGDALRVYEQLWKRAPDNIEHGLALARTQANAGDLTAFDTIDRLESMSDFPDPRISLAEATAAEALGDFDRERTAARRAAEQSRELGAWVLLARARLAEWWAERNIGDLEAATVASAEAWKIAKKIGDRSLVARALNAIATTKRQMGQNAEARELDLESLQVFREIGDKRREGWALNNLGLAAYEEGDFSEAMRYFQDSIQLAREIDDESGVARGLGNTGNVLYEIGELSQSESLFRQMLAVAETSSDRRSLPWARVNLAGTLTAMGRIPEATDLLESAKEGFELTREQRGIGWTLVRTGEIELYAGEYEKAEDSFRGALELFDGIRDQRARCWAAMRLAEAHLRQDEQHDAVPLLEEALSLQRSVNDRYGEAVNHTIASRLALESGDHARARELATRAASTFDALGIPNKQAEALAYLSRCQMSSGDVDGAQATLQMARSADVNHEDERLALLLDVTAAEIASQSGSEEGTMERLGRMRDAAIRAGYRDLALEADALIASLRS